MSHYRKKRIHEDSLSSFGGPSRIFRRRIQTYHWDSRWNENTNHDNRNFVLNHSDQIPTHLIIMNLKKHFFNKPKIEIEVDSLTKMHSLWLTEFGQILILYTLLISLVILNFLIMKMGIGMKWGPYWHYSVTKH